MVAATIDVVMFGGMCRYDDASGLMWRNIRLEADGSAFEIYFDKRKNSQSNSCTHIAGDCDKHNDQFINRHNATCQLTHAAIRSTFKGGGTLYSPHDFRLITVDAGTKQQTTNEDITDLTATPRKNKNSHHNHIRPTHAG